MKMATSKSSSNTAYCVKCKETVEIKSPKKVTMANGRGALKGVCPHCGTGVFRITG
jgi:hypothetical protein